MFRSRTFTQRCMTRVASLSTVSACSTFWQKKKVELIIMTARLCARHFKPVRVHVIFVCSSFFRLSFSALTTNRTETRAQRAPTPECRARGEGIPPVCDASFTKETHTRSLTQLPILGNMRQRTKACQTNSEVRDRRRRPNPKRVSPKSF